MNERIRFIYKESNKLSGPEMTREKKNSNLTMQMTSSARRCIEAENKVFRQFSLSRYTENAAGENTSR